MQQPLTAPLLPLLPVPLPTPDPLSHSPGVSFSKVEIHCATQVPEILQRFLITLKMKSSLNLPAAPQGSGPSLCLCPPPKPPRPPHSGHCSHMASPGSTLPHGVPSRGPFPRCALCHSPDFTAGSLLGVQFWHSQSGRPTSHLGPVPCLISRGIRRYLFVGAAVPSFVGLSSVFLCLGLIEASTIRATNSLVLFTVTYPST